MKVDERTLTLSKNLLVYPIFMLPRLKAGLPVPFVSMFRC